jgi:hypothetical protein
MRRQTSIFDQGSMNNEIVMNTWLSRLSRFESKIGSLVSLIEASRTEGKEDVVEEDWTQLKHSGKCPH